MKLKIKRVEAKNKRQREFMAALADYPLVISLGAAGSGKTFLSAYKALEALSYGWVDKIIIVRPIVATENIGFLPGDMEEKIDPYLIPLMDAFEDIIGMNALAELRKHNLIQFAALAYMRGRTLSRAFVILDEAQNTTPDQMRMFLTRFGEDVKVSITGDPTQSDIKGPNGLRMAVEKLANCKSVHIIQYENKEVVRSALVRDILYHLDKKESHNEQSQEIQTESDRDFKLSSR